MKQLTTILFLFFAISAYSQKINKALFKNTSWFASNNENSFFTRDTIKLIKHNVCIIATDIKADCEDEEKTISNERVIEIKFKSRKINLITKNGNGWSLSASPQSWKLKKHGILEIKFHKKIYLFRLIKINSINAKTNYNKDTPTLELVMVRIKKLSIIH
jgi:hypothetical protein